MYKLSSLAVAVVFPIVSRMSACLSVCLSVCLSACLSTLYISTNFILAQTSIRRMGYIER